MDPKPLFTDGVTPVTQSKQFKPQPAKSPAEPVKVTESKSFTSKPRTPEQPPKVASAPKTTFTSSHKAVHTNAEHQAMEAEKAKQLAAVKQEHMRQMKNKGRDVPVVPAKVLFPEDAVGENVVDPYYRDHPLCAGLSAKDVGRVRNLVKSANIQDTKYVLGYADDLRTQFATLVDQIVHEQSSGESAALNDTMRDILEIVSRSKQLVNLILNPPKRPSILARWIRISPEVPLVKDVRTLFRDDHYLVKKAVKSMENSITILVRLVNAFDEVFKRNRDNFVLLNLHIVAGNIIIEQHRLQTIPEMEKTLDKTNIFGSQDLVYFQQSVDRFERKIQDLAVIAHSVTLNAPTIRMLQNAVKDKADRIQRINQQVVPMWKQQSMILIESMRDDTNDGKQIDLIDFRPNRAVVDNIAESFTKFIEILS
jgi:uncharacterized protein YaaN involved in tellurite resistance